MGVGTVLEWVSNLTQIGTGLLALWASWHLRRIVAYRWPLLGIGICLILTGLAGVNHIGALAEINPYRRPLFIIERTLSAYVFFQVVLRNKLMAAEKRRD
jgi:hypothetical protein